MKTEKKSVDDADKVMIIDTLTVLMTKFPNNTKNGIAFVFKILKVDFEQFVFFIHFCFKPSHKQTLCAN